MILVANGMVERSTLALTGGINASIRGVVNSKGRVLLMVRGVRTTARVMMTPAQLRAARATLRWSQERLAKECKGDPDLSTLKRFEAEKSDPKQSTLLAWKRALSKAGVEFIDGDETRGPGVRLREPQR